MISGGLTSISFRKLTTEEIVSLVSKTDLTHIEWGGDVHVPHGDMKTAEQVRSMTADAGLRIASYGSYYKCVESPKSDPEFACVLDTAEALGAETVRIWAGGKSPHEADDDYRKAVMDDLSRICDAAAKAGLTISCEFHRHTLTETVESSTELMNAMSDHNLKTYWQPPYFLNASDQIPSLKKVLPSLTHVHAFKWLYENDNTDRRLLEEGRDEWMEYFNIISKTGRNHCAFIEFVKDDQPENFIRDAATLASMLAEINGNS